MNKSGKEYTPATENTHQNFLAGLLAAVIKTEQFKKVGRSLALEIIVSWHGKSMIKKICAAPLKWIATGLFRIKKSRRGTTPVKDYLATADAGQIGTVITAAARYINEVHQENPLYFSEKYRPAIRAVIAGTDFGEIKEMMTHSSDDLAGLAEVFNEEIWQYPAKMVILLSLLPNLFNIIITSLVKTVKPFNNIAPDLLCDVVVSIIHDIDRKSIGNLVNELTELVRKVHTGSALIGDRGNYAFPFEISDLVSEIVRHIDMPLLFKSRDMLADINHVIGLSFIDILEDNPDYAADYFQSHFRALTSTVRILSTKADAFERLFSDEDVAREFSKGMGELDPQDMADTVNRLCQLFNKVRQHTPGTIKSFLTQYFRSLDSFTVSETAQWLTSDIVTSIKPLAPEILPPLINGIAKLIAPEGEVSADMKDACINLKKSFNLLECRDE